MKVAILAGGLGERMAEETRSRPKALVEIGGLPILWHLMRYYSSFGHDEFVIAGGHRGRQIAAFLAGREGIRSAVHMDGERHEILRRGNGVSRIAATLVETGARASSAARFLALRPHLGGETFLLTWCDGLSDVDLDELVRFHATHGRLATVTAIRPPARFGRLRLDGTRVAAFDEKAPLPDEWINGAFFVVEPSALDRIEAGDQSLETGLFRRLAEAGELMAYRHEGFWQCMDTIYERDRLDALWRDGQAPWKNWTG